MSRTSSSLPPPPASVDQSVLPRTTSFFAPQATPADSISWAMFNRTMPSETWISPSTRKPHVKTVLEALATFTSASRCGVISNLPPECLETGSSICYMQASASNPMTRTVAASTLGAALEGQTLGSSLQSKSKAPSAFGSHTSLPSRHCGDMGELLQLSTRASSSKHIEKTSKYSKRSESVACESSQVLRHEQLGLARFRVKPFHSLMRLHSSL